MLGGDLGGAGVDLDGCPAQFLGTLGTQIIDDAGEGDVLVVVADLRLRRRGEDGFRQFGRLGQPSGQFHATHLTSVPVLLQPRSGEVAAHDAFEGQHVQLAADLGPAEDTLGNARVIRRSGEVVGDVEGGEEEVAHRGEDAALVRDRAVQDEVIGRDPVGGHHEQGVLVDLVDLADLPGREVGVVGEVGARLLHGLQSVVPTREKGHGAGSVSPAVRQWWPRWPAALQHSTGHPSTNARSTPAPFPERELHGCRSGACAGPADYAVASDECTGGTKSDHMW